jgi:hypothetical protein
MPRRFFYVGRSWLIKLGSVALVAGGVAQQLGGYHRLVFHLAWSLCCFAGHARWISVIPGGYILLEFMLVQHIIFCRLN